MLNARIVGQDDVAARGVAKQTNDGGMSAIEDANDASFGALSGRARGSAAELGENVIAVHGVFHSIAGDENVAIEVGHGLVGDHEAITIGVKNKPAGDGVAGPLGRRLWRRGLRRAISAHETKTGAGELFDEPALFESGEKLQKGAARGFGKMERTQNFFGGMGSFSNLQETKDIIGTKGSLTGHKRSR